MYTGGGARMLNSGISPGHISYIKNFSLLVKICQFLALLALGVFWEVFWELLSEVFWKAFGLGRNR